MQSESPDSPNVAFGGLDYESVRQIVRHLLPSLPGAEDAGSSTTNVDSILPAIAGYAFVSELGSGAGGQVYLAYRDGSDRLLAVKIFRAELANRGGIARIRREIDVLERLRIEAAPRVIEHGIANDRLWVSTEFIDGQTITQYAQEQKLDRSARVALMADVCDAAQSLHQSGVIHRDLKPPNLLVDSAGRPVIIDFGIASLVDSDIYQTLTPDNVAIGTPAFMSPEQARGELDLITTQSDIYSLGAIAYALLVGQTPHDVDAAHGRIEILHRIGRTSARDPLEIDSTLPKPLAAVLRKATAFDRADRYASASNLAEEFRRWLKGEPVEAQPPSRLGRVLRWSVRHPIAMTSAVCATIAISTIALTWLGIWFITQKPAEIRFDVDRETWARVMAHSGKTLHEWDGRRDKAIAIAEFVDHGRANDGYPIGLLGFTSASSEYRGQLCAFDLRDPETPLWSIGVDGETFAMPEPISTVAGEEFYLFFAFLEEIFEELPGPEIVAVHGEITYSANVLRIYSLSGEVLYEAWHDGGIYSAVWARRANPCLCCGQQ